MMHFLVAENVADVTKKLGSEYQMNYERKTFKL